MCIQDSAAIANFELGYFSYLVFYNAEKLPKDSSYKHSIFVDYSHYDERESIQKIICTTQGKSKVRQKFLLINFSS